MKTFAIRLTQGMDLKKELINFTLKNNIKAGCILTCVGHLSKAKLRMANANVIKEFNQELEILSLSGTLCQDDIHLHITLSDENGNCVGGHLKNECIVGVTAEIIIAKFDNFTFKREIDKKTGYKELVINNI
ncbi:MAG: DNA-binding protein [Nanoarchaeota archaeon]|nr:DNA-binding protein [Nanoarchaeota archaeon]MCA9496570.1 DNA-binding protein [Nanoarchaeota archaeon]